MGATKTKNAKNDHRKFPCKAKKRTKKKNEDWAWANEKNELINANQNAGRRQKEIEKIDQMDSKTRKKLTLLNAITAWKKIAELSRKGHVKWASAKIIDISDPRKGRKTRIGEYNDRMYDASSELWVSHEQWKMITNHINKERKNELRRVIRDHNRGRNAKIREKNGKLQNR
eukprot:GEMP01044263.1.p1 GENE.GEMP01044263.1~~GEMP01044263.1.p1  ORF type:complete len:172 (+),score=17.16 GEMP01044263.1:277-792(+)